MTATSGDTLVFGAAADPTSLDGAVVSDGESLRVITQIMEGLVTLKPGTTTVVPQLASKWKAASGGRVWTFTLRKGVTFHDGTPFNARAVCANFDRWYNFTGAFASDATSYYYYTVFGGYKKPAKGLTNSPLYRSCRAAGDSTAVITLRRPNASFLGALSLQSFAIQSPTALAKYGANKGTLSKDGVFAPGGDYGVPGGQAVGTGPFKLESWKIGDKLEIVRNDSYWGRKAFLRRVIFRAIPDNAARLQALQTGEIQGYDLVEPQDIATIKKNKKLKTLDRPAFNVAYVTINQAVKPFDNILVRQAVAHGLDRAGVVKIVLRRPRRGCPRVHAAARRRLLEDRDEVPVQPEQGQAAPAEGRRHAAARGRVLVSDRCVASLHAGPGAELPGIRREPEQVGLQGRAEERSVAARLRRSRAGRNRRRPQPDRVDG